MSDYLTPAVAGRAGTIERPCAQIDKFASGYWQALPLDLPFTDFARSAPFT